MKLSEKIKELDFKGRDFPIIAGTVKFKLHNVHNGKDEVVEEHNMATNALKDIFTNNYGGLINYQNFASLYNTWLGGVLLFQNQLDLTSADDYGIPDSATNPVKAHAGQTPLTDQADDLTRGNTDSTGTVLAVNSTKLRWEWGTSAGNGTIASLGLTHSDVGSYGAGVVSTAQRSLNPFVDIACISRQAAYGNNANYVLGLNNNIAYNFYLVDNTTVRIYKTPINNTKFKLQGGSLLPLTDYTTTITATLPNSYNRQESHGYYNNCYYWFDFANNKLVLFAVPTEGGETLYRDDIDLNDGTITHQTITVTGAHLWKLRMREGDWQGLGIPPTSAIILGNYLFLYGYDSNGSYEYPNLIYKLNLSNTADVTQVDTSDYSDFCPMSNARANERFTALGGIIVHDSFLINGDKTFALAQKDTGRPGATPIYNYLLSNKISSPVFRTNASANMISVCKLYLATKFNLPNAVTKTSAQSMSVEYQLSEV